MNASKLSSLRRPQAVAVALAAAVGLAMLPACGGGDGDGSGGSGGPGDPVVGGTEVPQSATTSAAGAFAFVASVAANASDSSEPLIVGDAVLATSDSDEPAAL